MAGDRIENCYRGLFLLRCEGFVVCMREMNILLFCLNDVFCDVCFSIRIGEIFIDRVKGFGV